MLSSGANVKSSGTKCYHLELMLSSGMQCYHLVLMLSSGTKCYHLGWNVIIWDEMLSYGANFIIWDEMLSSGTKCYHLELILSSGMQCYHLELVLSSGTKCYLELLLWYVANIGNVIIWWYHVMLSSGMITHPFFYFSCKLHSLVILPPGSGSGSGFSWPKAIRIHADPDLHYWI